MLTRILSGPSTCVGLGGNHISVPESDEEATALVQRFNAATIRLWDRKAESPVVSEAGREMVEIIDRLRDLPAYRDVTHVIYKRSFPFGYGDALRPDLSDLFSLFDDVRLVVTYRDPCASTASSWRRNFGPTLRSCAVVTEEQLGYIAAQLSTLDPADYLRYRYEQFCVAPEPTLRRIARLCQLPEDLLLEQARSENVRPDRRESWRADLGPEEVAFLERFFDDRRRRQWALLGQERVSWRTLIGSRLRASRKGDWRRQAG
jgi:hypothetical protein